MEEDEEAIRKRLAPSSPASSPVTESPIFLGHGLTPPRRMSTVESGQMDPERNRFPFCIVWTPLPLITWLLPFIGHTGICSSRGLIYDFAGSYYVSEDNMAFGWPVKVLQMDLEKVKGGANAWDKGILEANRIYRRRAHNLFCDNCHSHVAAALNQMEYEGSTNWTMFWVWWRALQGRYLNWWNVLRVWFPPVVLWGMVLTVMWAITDPVVQGIKAAQQ
ncbi:unnamed protein product [Cyprideis torosa]|uniref:Uncharacterized protein n=1 Tax=Cyprideis torosa TaxID=163714 RepID=A0A7R8ZMB9_9CRUS|nr:unnamed protein product [Cyprideis torosa]CAG0884020.1 unnamed protein product [Cyprideis torosa]